jgi:uncharacterized protein (DUF1501 family)
MTTDQMADQPTQEQGADSPARRTFLKRSAQLAFTGAALPTALNLAAIGDAAAFSAPDGSYKALVCVFLFGANDYANTVVAYDDVNYDKYAAIRGGGANRAAGGIALAKADLAATLLSPTVPLAGGRQFALHPAMTGLANLFNNGQAAVQLNVGPLVEPLTKDQYNAGTKRLPTKLFSHNDQQSVWQSSQSEGSTIGWGGNLGDFGVPVNGSLGSTFSCISLAGNAVYLAGDAAIAYQVSTDGAVKLTSVSTNKVFNSTPVANAVNQMIKQTGTHAFEIEYNKVTQRSINAETSVTAALGSGNAVSTDASYSAFTSTMLTENSLARQMKMVARMIAGRASLGNPKRQVFMVSLGGFDLHDFLIDQHPKLLRYVSEAMTAFHDATVKLGVDNQVTSFTASDFGRTLSSNGDGSDHGWGSHHFVVGGAVKGKAFYGIAPPISVGSTTAPDDQWHVGQGRLLPTTSVDQYAATMATWFGVENTELATVVPNIGNFDNVTLTTTSGPIVFQKNMGFMKP